MEPLYLVLGLLGVWLLSLGAAWWAGRATLDDTVASLKIERGLLRAELQRAHQQGAKVRDAGTISLEAERLAGSAPPGRPGLGVLSGADPERRAAPAGGEAGGHVAGDPGVVPGPDEVAGAAGGPVGRA